MQVVFSAHAAKRMGERRQRGITRSVIQTFAKMVPGRIAEPIALPLPYRHRTFLVVMVDKEEARIIVSVIGMYQTKRRRHVP